MTERREQREQRRAERPTTETGGTTPTVRWDDSKMRSSYANVCNVASTREEIVLLFGVNQAWHGNVTEVTVQLTDRIILNPHAAKRLAVLLTNLVREYESRFGVVDIEARRPGEASVQ